MLLLSIYVLYSNVTYIFCIMSCGNKIVSNCKTNNSKQSMFCQNTNEKKVIFNVSTTLHDSEKNVVEAVTTEGENYCESIEPCVKDNKIHSMKIQSPKTNY